MIDAPLTFTLDLEDHRPDGEGEARHPEVVRRLLDDLDSIGVRGTVFVVGALAEAEPGLIKEVAARGHELALHDWSHLQLDRSDPDRFRRDTARGVAVLEDLGQRPVLGYRAATFSLIPSTVWATDVLAELGVEYSSSVLPASNPLYGFPTAPRTPFTWPSGLLEIPAPLIDLGVTAVPLGGTYLRLLPLALVQRRARLGPSPFLYCHPYDLDPDEPFWWEPVAGAMAPLLWVGRRGFRAKLLRLLRHAAPPLGERLESVRAVAQPFDPAGSGSQRDMLHHLPDASCVDRIDWLTARATGRRVVHLGFVDSGYRAMQEDAGTWLHAHLDRAAGHLVGIDLDEEGVAAAVAGGYEAYAVDCRDADAVRAAGIRPAELVIAGEVIEHLDAPGPFLDGLHELVAPGGELILTTPNASGLLNSVAAVAGLEVNHPDHVVMFTWSTLRALLERHGWEIVDTATYVPTMKGAARQEASVGTLVARGVLFAERALGRAGAPFVADGLIVRCRSVR